MSTTLTDSPATPEAATTPSASPAEEAPVGTPVPGSDGLLLEIDGKIVPNYAATLIQFEDGDVVQGTVVRIDRDEGTHAVAHVCFSGEMCRPHMRPDASYFGAAAPKL